MKVSIITVTYNSATTIVDTIESVLQQTYPHIEYIVVDGGSKDDTIEQVKRFETAFGDRLKWISEPDKGIYDAMNKGIAMASGDSWYSQFGRLFYLKASNCQYGQCF